MSSENKISLPVPVLYELSIRVIDGIPECSERQKAGSRADRKAKTVDESHHISSLLSDLLRLEVWDPTAKQITELDKK